MIIIGVLAVLQFFMVKSEHPKTKLVTLGRIAIEFIICLVLYIVIITKTRHAGDDQDKVDALKHCGDSYDGYMQSLSVYYDDQQQ